MMKALARCTLAILTLLVACLALSLESVAHDLWLVPTPWMVGPGQPSQLDLVSGIKFPAPDLEEHAYTAEDVARAVIRGPNGSRALSKPQVVKGSLRYENKLTAPGLYCSAAKTKPGFESYSPKEFEEYLEDDGFEQTAKERRRLGETAFRPRQGRLGHPLGHTHLCYPIRRAVIRLGVPLGLLFPASAISQLSFAGLRGRAKLARVTSVS
jgi:hypothetical protein